MRAARDEAKQWSEQHEIVSFSGHTVKIELEDVDWDSQIQSCLEKTAKLTEQKEQQRLTNNRVF